MYSLAQISKGLPQEDISAIVTPSDGVTISMFKKYDSEWKIESIEIEAEIKESIISPDAHSTLRYPITYELEVQDLYFDIPGNVLTPNFNGKLITVNETMTIDYEKLLLLDNFGIQLPYVRVIRTTEEASPSLISRVCPSTLLVDVIGELHTSPCNYFEYGFMVTNIHNIYGEILYSAQTTKYYDEISKNDIGVNNIVNFLSTKPFQPNFKYATNCGI